MNGNNKNKHLYVLAFAVLSLVGLLMVVFAGVVKLFGLEGVLSDAVSSKILTAGTVLFIASLLSLIASLA